MLLLTSLLITVILINYSKDDVSTPENPDYSQDKGEFKDIRDSKVYKWVKIGDQIWMAENLSYTGGGIQHITDNDEWRNNTAYDAWCYYDNNENYASTYGVLYQFEAAKKACPEGWHLPNDAEWSKLEQFIENDGHSGNEGASLKSLTRWEKGEGETDDYGFSALPSGHRGSIGDFDYLGCFSYWWSATESNIFNTAYRRRLSYYNAGVNRNIKSKSFGFSVRCIKD